MIIYADKREDSRVPALLEQSCTLKRKQLKVGDYLLSKRVAVERKTCQDFVQSIIDGRLFRQVEELKANFEKPLMIIEGEDFDLDIKIHPNAIKGAIASISIDYGVPIIWTVTQKETSEFLLTIAKREQEGKKRGFAVRGTKKKKSMNDVQEFLIAGLPNINTKTAKNLLKHFGKPEKIFAASEAELQEMPGMGPKTAKNIRKILSKRYEKSILE